jgi:type IV pilus assembly protein PilP
MQYQRQNNRNRTWGISALTFFALAVLLAGCSDSQKTAPPPAAPAASGIQIQKQPASASTGTVPATMEEKPAEEYAYRTAGRRDPFAPIISKQEKKQGLSERPPLERYNISEFKLGGIVWGGFGYNAILEGPDQKGYFVRVGSIVGPNRGIIKKITQNTIVIEEKFKNTMGEVERKEIVVELRKKQEGTP